MHNFVYYPIRNIKIAMLLIDVIIFCYLILICDYYVLFHDYYVFGWVINNFRVLKASSNYAFQTCNILNTTVNYLIK